jgi:hypothetical protein
MENPMQEEEEEGLIMLIQQYARTFGIGFNSAVMDDPELKTKLMKLMMEALAGKRGAITDADFDD